MVKFENYVPVFVTTFLESPPNTDVSKPDPDGWVWHTGSQISDQVKKGYRIVVLKLYSTSTFHLTTSLPQHRIVCANLVVVSKQ